ncbi:hypothetical protein BGZ94_008546 [Podila epigama]|nr:hypothetical protein BGZ94_008546 [Podila epigama]
MTKASGREGDGSTSIVFLAEVLAPAGVKVWETSAGWIPVEAEVDDDDDDENERDVAVDRDKDNEGEEEDGGGGHGEAKVGMEEEEGTRGECGGEGVRGLEEGAVIEFLP